MSKKICSAGVRGPFSYVIVDSLTDEGITSTIHEDEDEPVATRHTSMEYAEQWIDKQLSTLIGRKYETD